jgi:hypothetical protein
MIIYKDILTGEELFSDAYKMKFEKGVYEVEGKRITVKEGIDDSKIGGNASAEGGAEALDDGTTTGINVVISHKLKQIDLRKKDYQGLIKKYMKSILEKLKPERVDGFKVEATDCVKKILADFDNFEFFISENSELSDALEGKCMVVVMNYREDGITPYFLFFADGVIEEKV